MEGKISEEEGRVTCALDIEETQKERDISSWTSLEGTVHKSIKNFVGINDASKEAENCRQGEKKCSCWGL